MLINFVILYFQILCMTKQETQLEMGCGKEKPRPKRQVTEFYDIL